MGSPQVVFAALLVPAEVRAAPTVLVNPLETELGWSRATISLAVSIGLLLYGLSGPVSGWLMAAMMTLLVRWQPASANPAEARS